jgi:hypothetical protein
MRKTSAKKKIHGRGLMIGQDGRKRKPCRPGTHDFVWDAAQNKHHIDGGKVKDGLGYYSCTRCGDLAGDAHETESGRQTISRIERERERVQDRSQEIPKGDGLWQAEGIT